jgi:zinc transport system substrate-binding protein
MRLFQKLQFWKAILDLLECTGMKRFVVCVCLFALLVAGAGARGRGDMGKADGKISVVATIFPPYDFVREVAGDRINLAMLLPPAAESHSFEPTPRDIITVQNCDVFIYVGGESDAWVETILESMDTSGMKVLTLMDCVDVVEEVIVEGMQEEEDDEEGSSHDHAEEAEEAELDEHVWTSPRNAQLIVRKIADVLKGADPANATAYEKNAVAYNAKLAELDASFQNALKDAKRKTIVFGDRFPFRYFADAYGLSYFAAFPGCSTETEASAATVAFLIDKVRVEQIPVVFHIELSNEKIADTICEETGAKKLLLHAVHNVSKRDFEGGASYYGLMSQNVESLRAALQ